LDHPIRPLNPRLSFPEAHQLRDLKIKVLEVGCEI